MLNFQTIALTPRLFFLLVLLVSTLPGRSQSSAPISIGSSYKLHSNLLGEEREYIVQLPQSYQQDEFYVQKRYPVVVLLDADTHFRYASTMMQFLSTGEVEQIPEMIVVAVRNTNRLRDMTSTLPPEADPFLGFLEKELLPRIDQQYRTLPYRLLVGHSLAGLFALNCLLTQRDFNAYIIIDPTLTYKDGAVLKKTEAVLATDASLTGRLFLAQANNPLEPGQHTGVRGKAFEAFKTHLTSYRSPRLAHQYAFYAQDNHYSVPLQGLRDGLLFIFEQYQFPFPVLLTQGNAGVKRHYEHLARQLSIDLLPPGKVINQAGLFLLNNQKQVDQALGLFSLNQLYYPDSYVTYNSLGDAYKAKGDKPMAIKNYEKALILNAKDEKARKALQELTNP